MMKVPKFEQCENCGAIFVDGQWRSNGKDVDNRYLSARVCSLQVNKGRLEKCKNPMADWIDPASEFGFPDLDKLDAELLPRWNFFRILNGQQPEPMIWPKINWARRAWIERLRRFFAL